MSTFHPQFGYQFSGLISEVVITTGTVYAEEIDEAVSEAIIQNIGREVEREPLTITSKQVTYVLTKRDGERLLLTVFRQPSLSQKRDRLRESGKEA
jgi:predicted short-subunit dehydrogenase-like oxidoreductase (DUF2520 family)